MAAFSDTSTQTGLIQKFERNTRQPYGSLTGNSLKEATDYINEAFEELMPLVLMYNDQIRWDDINHTDAPIGYVNLVASQNDYKITVDDNSLDILNFTNIRILPSSSASAYVELERITLDDPRVPEIMSPDSTLTGVPSGFLEVGNTIYLDILPSYSATSGIELFFQREQSYFVSTDTTKEPGIPKPFHSLLALIAAYNWNLINRTDDAGLISRQEVKIKRDKANFKAFMDARHPSRMQIQNKKVNHR